MWLVGVECSFSPLGFSPLVQSILYNIILCVRKVAYSALSFWRYFRSPLPSTCPRFRLTNVVIFFHWRSLIIGVHIHFKAEIVLCGYRWLFLLMIMNCIDCACAFSCNDGRSRTQPCWCPINSGYGRIVTRWKTTNRRHCVCYCLHRNFFPVISQCEKSPISPRLVQHSTFQLPEG